MTNYSTARLEPLMAFDESRYYQSADRYSPLADVWNPVLQAYTNQVYALSQVGLVQRCSAAEALAANPFEPLVDDRGIPLL